MTAERFLEEGLQKLSSDSLLPFIEWLDTVYSKSYSDHEMLLRASLARLTVALEEIPLMLPQTHIRSVPVKDAMELKNWVMEPAG